MMLTRADYRENGMRDCQNMFDADDFGLSAIVEHGIASERAALKHAQRDQHP